MHTLADDSVAITTLVLWGSSYGSYTDHRILNGSSDPMKIRRIFSQSSAGTIMIRILSHVLRTFCDNHDTDPWHAFNDNHHTDPWHASYDDHHTDPWYASYDIHHTDPWHAFNDNHHTDPWHISWWKSSYKPTHVWYGSYKYILQHLRGRHTDPIHFSYGSYAYILL